MSVAEIEHLVLFRFKEETTHAMRMAMFDGLRALKQSIPEIVELDVGDNLTDRGKGWTCGLRVRLRVTPATRGEGALAALEAYQTHPDHQRVLQTLIKPIVADVVAIDFTP